MVHLVHARRSTHLGGHRTPRKLALLGFAAALSAASGALGCGSTQAIAYVHPQRPEVSGRPLRDVRLAVPRPRIHPQLVDEGMVAADLATFDAALREAITDTGAMVVPATDTDLVLDTALRRFEATYRMENKTVGEGQEQLFMYPTFHGELAVEIRRGAEVLWSGPVRYDGAEVDMSRAEDEGNLAAGALVRGARDRLLEALSATATPNVAARPASAVPALAVSLPQPARILVLPLQPVGTFDPGACQLVGNFLLSTLAGVRGAETLGKDDMDAVLSADRQRQAVGCDSLACLAEIGGALGVDLVLHGELGLVGATHTLNASLVRTHDAAVVARASTTVSGPADALLGEVPGLVAELVRRLAPAAGAAPAP